MAANGIQIKNALQKPDDRILFTKEVLSPVFGSGVSLSSSLFSATVNPTQGEQFVIVKVAVYGKIRLENQNKNDRTYQ